MKKIILCKLITGETIIGYSESENEKDLLISFPLTLNLVPTPQGVGLAFQPAIIGIKNNVPVSIPKSSIICTVKEEHIDPVLKDRYIEQTTNLVVPTKTIIPPTTSTN